MKQRSPEQRAAVLCVAVGLLALPIGLSLMWVPLGVIMIALELIVLGGVYIASDGDL